MNENLPLDMIIDLSDCSVWQQDHLVLTDVNLKLGKGEFIYLVCRVGSGKTSLIKTLNAQIPLKDGKGPFRVRSDKDQAERGPHS